MIKGTEKEARAALRALIAGQDKGGQLPIGSQTLGTWLDDYAKTWSGHLSPQTQEKAAEILTLYLPAPARKVRLTAVTPALLQTIYNALEATGKAPATVSLLHRTLRSRLQKALELGLMATNPASLARPPKAMRREYRVLSADEAKRFLQLAEPTRFGALWTLLLHTGLRPEEALGLKWEDLEGDVLRVRRALVRLRKGRWDFRETKTGTGRTVIVSTSAGKALQRLRVRQAQFRLQLGPEYHDHGLIFSTEDGKPLDWRPLAQRYFKPLRDRLALELAGKPSMPPAFRSRHSLTGYKDARGAFAVAARTALKATGLDRLRPYDLRHSAASLLLSADLHPKLVQAMLGHASIKLTLDTYSHLVPGLEKKAADQMESLLGDPQAERATGRP